MSREIEGLQQIAMRSWHKLIFFGVIILWSGSAATLHAQLKGKSSCLAIHIALNGKPVAEPRTLTFKTKAWEQAVPVVAGCFKVPAAVLEEKTIDVLFTVPGNRIYLSTIPIGFLAGPWDVELQDQRFGNEVVLPKHTRTKDACSVVFHVGEPETVYAMTPCRTRLK
ncbi:MAG TPA: hypothetical protein VGG46_06250 [Terriglobales bacterium]|jgi:hypothetical protein